MVGDEAFRALVLGRIIEPTGEVDTIRVLSEVGVGAVDAEQGVDVLLGALGALRGRA